MTELLSARASWRAPVKVFKSRRSKAALGPRLLAETSSVSSAGVAAIYTIYEATTDPVGHPAPQAILNLSIVFMRVRSRSAAAWHPRSVLAHARYTKALVGCAIR